MNNHNSLFLELALVVITAIICSLFLLNSQLKEFKTPHSWVSLTAKLIKIQKLCRNAAAVRKVDNVVEFINSDGLLMNFIINKDLNSTNHLELQIKSETTIKDTIKIDELNNLIIHFKEPFPGTYPSDVSLKGTFMSQDLPLPVSVFMDLSLSNPRLFQELDL